MINYEGYQMIAVVWVTFLQRSGYCLLPFSTYTSRSTKYILLVLKLKGKAALEKVVNRTNGKGNAQAN